MEPRSKPRKTKAQAKRAPDRTLGVTLLSAGAALIGIGGAVAALLLTRRTGPAPGHPAPDLAPGATVPPVATTPANAEPTLPILDESTRAPEHFRPDPTGIPTAEEREALRPVTGPAPSLAADRGSVTAEAQDAA